MDPQNTDNQNNPQTGSQLAADIARQKIESLREQSGANLPGARPDPEVDRIGYEQWYYKLTPAHQQAEWDKYYQTTQQHDANQHVVSEEYAHTHTVPREVTTHTPQQQAESQQLQTPQPMAQQTAQPSTPQYPASQPQQQSNRFTTQQQPQTPGTTTNQAAARRRRRRNPFRSLVAASAIALVISFVFYNELVVGQVRSYISPASTVSTPVIIDPDQSIDVGPEAKVIIPKINVDVPVVYDVTSLEEDAIQEGLNEGVVDYNYPGSVNPGEIGNNIIVGHSSNNFLNSGKYKFAFVLLDRLELDDTFILHYEGTRYVYKVTTKEVIEPDDFRLVSGVNDKPITTLITCSPPGTSWRRLVIQGEQISPSIDTAKEVAAPTSQAVPPETPVPGNSPSLWSRITDIF